MQSAGFVAFVIFERKRQTDGWPPVVPPSCSDCYLIVVLNSLDVRMLAASATGRRAGVQLQLNSAPTRLEVCL